MKFPGRITPILIIVSLILRAMVPAYSQDKDTTHPPPPSSEAATAQETPIRFVDTPYPPYTIGEEGRQAEAGIAVDIAREACRRMGHRCRITLHPWERVLKMMETGAADGVLFLVQTPERERFLLFTPPVVRSRELFYASTLRHREFSWKTITDLDNLTIGLVRGYTYGENFMDYIETGSADIDYTADTILNLRKLVAGRIDLVLEEELVAEYLLKEIDPDGEAVVRCDESVSEYDYHLAFSRFGAAAELFPAYEAAVEEMKRDGTIQEIVRRYTR